MKKIFILFSLLFVVSVAFAQTTVKKRIDSTALLPIDSFASFVGLNATGATRRFSKDDMKAFAAAKQLSISGSLVLANLYPQYKDYIICENGGTRVTALVDATGKVWKVGESVDLSAYLTSANAASTYTTKSDYLANKTLTDNNINYVSANLATETANRTASDAAAASYIDATYQKKVGLATSNNVLYVSRKWTGTRGGASWQAQLDLASVGSPVATFPDPWAARDAAAKLLVAKTIPKATIIVYEGESFTTSQVEDNVSADYVYRNINGNSQYHPYPASTSITYDDSLCLSIMFPNLLWDFKKGSGIVHLSGKGCLAMAYDTSAIQSIRGLGNFDYTLSNISDNRNVIYLRGKGLTEFECDSIVIKNKVATNWGWAIIELNSTGSNFIKANYAATWDGNFLFRTLRNSDIRVTNLKIDSTLQCNDETGFVIGTLGLSSSNTTINIENLTLGSMSFGYFGSNIVNTNLNVNVKNVAQKYIVSTTNKIGNMSNISEDAFIQLWYYEGQKGYTNSNINVAIGNYRGQMQALSGNNDPLLCRNLIAKFDFGNWYQDSMHLSNIVNKVSISIPKMNSDSSLFLVKGNFINKKQAVALISNNCSYTLEGIYKTLSTTLSPLSVTGDNSNTKIAANLTVNGTQSSISGTGTITVLPNSTANTERAETVTLNGTLSVNANFKQ